jgi:hypothetical protein
MKIDKIMLYVGYTMSAVFALGGIIILSGSVIPDHLPTKFRITLGIVLILYSIYRFITVRMKKRQQDEERTIL